MNEHTVCKKVPIDKIWLHRYELVTSVCVLGADLC